MQRNMAVLLQSMNSPSRSFDFFNFSADQEILKNKEPVLSLTTFLLDSFDVVEWSLVQRRKKKVHHPAISFFFVVLII
jgi:hypothetical protein